MKKYLFVIGDVHGEYDLFTSLVKEYDKACHQLVLIGDLIDRGSRSKECLLLAKDLVENNQAVCLKGNHEDIFLRFLKDPEERFDNYILNGGGETIESLLHSGAVLEYSRTEISLMIQSRYKELLIFLENLPYFYEWENFLCVHAGVNLSLSDWTKTSHRDFLWIRKEFHEEKNKTNRKIIFGHTPTRYLYQDMIKTSLWLSDNKIGIDGGAVYGGSLHGVIFNKETIIQDIELKNSQEWKPAF